MLVKTNFVTVNKMRVNLSCEGEWVAHTTKNIVIYLNGEIIIC
ncbi:hypothetical protein HMPREF0454_02238 [Hafnia alvei ATCC 51873]|uniref:Uncharacterized protein n=1 Tax=Hafnia alvei ATCC 51873 TaxID=1002364 RepID=G9Y6F5_HAFAL|nr:hypothetical protein HMPREF0454_02238 [Hafnia alvei ATCC 51873]